jgi:uncharacterized oxidoreductase
VPGTEPKIVCENEAIAILDGCKRFGQIVSKKAMRIAIDKPKGCGVAIVCYANVHHVGRLGEYVSMAAEEHLIAIMFANGARPGGLVAPFRARQRVFGTNPM